MAELVYLLCSLTSSLCSLLLYRSFRRSGSKLLFWAALCFIGLTLNNIVLLLDSYVVEGQGLIVFRVSCSVVGAGALLYGMIWETT